MEATYTAMLCRLASSPQCPYDSPANTVSPDPDGGSSVLTDVLCTVFRLASIHFIFEPDPSTSASPSSSSANIVFMLGIDLRRRVAVPAVEVRALRDSGGGSGLRILLESRQLIRAKS